MPGHHVNGALTVGENIGDLGGLTIALLAYEISLGGQILVRWTAATGNSDSFTTGRRLADQGPGRSWHSSFSQSIRTRRPSSAPTSCAISTNSTPRMRPPQAMHSGSIQRTGSVSGDG